MQDLVVHLLRRGDRCPLEAGLLAQDRAVQLLERGARIDSELLRQSAARVLIRRERFGLPARAVEREHQLAARPLAQRLLLDQRLELADHLGVPAELEIGLDPIFERGKPQLRQPPDLGLGERLELELGERRASPEGERLTQRRRLARTRPLRAPAKQLLETVHVDRAPVDAQHVARRPRLEHVGPEELPQLRDQVVQRRRCRSRRLLAPQLVDQPFARYELAGPQQEQEREQGALALPRQREELPRARDLERAQKPKLEHLALLVTVFTIADKAQTGHISKPLDAR